MSSLQLIKDSSGTYIPSSQRPDGTWRKPIRVKEGYTPQEEQPIYVSKGRQNAMKSGYPVGMTSSDVTSSNFETSGYFEVGNFRTETAIPGLNFVESKEDKVSVVSKKKKSKGNKTTNDEKSKGSQPPSKNQSSSNNTNVQNSTTDPAKRLRNLRKKIKEIENLESKIESGEVPNPEKEQLEKIQRKDEVMDEIFELEKKLERMSLS